jgi:hypothetical protein
LGLPDGETILWMRPLVGQRGGREHVARDLAQIDGLRLDRYAGHGQVRQHDVWLQPGAQMNGLPTGLGFANDLEAGGFQQAAEPVAEQWVVVSDQNALAPRQDGTCAPNTTHSRRVASYA